MTQEDRKQSTVLTRNELYQQVWSTPMKRLAAQYGITGTGLAKICARLDVPCPPRGYWAKKAVGKKVVQYRLPEPGANTPLQVTITPAPTPPKPTPAQAELQKQLEIARAKQAELTVPARLARPHPIIAAWLADQERKKQEALRERDPLIRRMMQPKAFTEIDRRQHRFLDALFKALQPLGFTIKSGEYQRVHFEFQKERIEYQLREKQKQVRRPLTEDEKRWSYASDRGWVQELQPTANLVFKIKTWLSNSIRTEWKDETDRSLESQLPDIVAALSLAGPFLVKQSQDRAEAEKLRWEEERRRYLERQHQEQDERRWQRFLKLAQQCDEAASARRLLAELEARPTPEEVTFGGHPSGEWLAWAREWVARFDPLTQEPQEIYKQLASI